MGLTQVMLQVKGCEMVCKQRELIPRLRRLSPAGTELSSYLPTLLPLLPLHPPPTPSSTPPPPLSSLSNNLWQRSAEAVRGHQKGTQTQREMPSAYKNETGSGSIQFTPFAQHHSASIHQHHHRRASESASQRGPTPPPASQLPVIQRRGLFYNSIAFEGAERNWKMSHRSVVSLTAENKTWLCGRRRRSIKVFIIWNDKAAVSLLKDQVRRF